MEFYNKFIALCKENNVSPSSVARACGLGTPNITYWKNGSIPKLETIKKIATHFQVPMSYFFDIPDDEMEFSEFVLSQVSEIPKAKALRIDSGEEGEEVELHFDLTGGKAFKNARSDLKKICDELNLIGILKTTSYVEGLLENPMYNKKNTPDKE